MSENKSTSTRLIQLTYIINLVTAGFALLFGIVCLLLDLNDLAYYHFFTIELYFFGAYLSKNGSTLYSRILFFSLLNLGIILTSSYIGKEGSVEYIFLYSLALPFSMFSFRKEKVYVYFFSFLSGISWILLTSTNFKLIASNPIDTDIARMYIYPISMTSTFIMVIAQLTFFSTLGAKYYSKIRIKKQEAEEASLAKSKFLSTMSHEIRTPLNAVIGLSHILGVNEPREDQKQNIEALNYSGKTLLSLLNNVLDFSKMQSTTIELDNITTDISSDAKQIKKIHSASALRKGIIFNLEVDDNIPFVWLDVIRFNQIVNNLVSNAIKFTDKGSVTLIIKKTKQVKNTITLHVEVKDTGIGIPKNKQKTIWNAFTQASNTTNRIYGGTGLGLPIVKSIIEVMDSKVKLQSVKNKGSRFYFDLKLKIAEEKDLEKVTKKTTYTFEGKKVLLVDDNLINIMVGKQILEKSKLKVEVANDGLAAVNKVKEQDFDIVLMDIQMPIMDGYTATKEIRKFNKNLPVIALSANVFMEIKDKIEECGMNGFIFKPFTPEDLLHQVENFTSK